MNAYRSLMIAALFMAASMAVMTGCEYDIAQPQWEKDYQAPAKPVITQIEPAQAAPGVNTITIRGQNFAGVPNTNGVYFDNVPAEIIEKSATAITVRRPNLVTDSCTVKVVSDSALVVAKFGPYRIAPVLERYGSFLDNVPLGAMAVDNAENLYVVNGDTSYRISKVTPGGQNVRFGRATRIPTDARIANGYLILLSRNRQIERMDLATGVVTQWVQLASGKSVAFGDFDAAGYFYAGGRNTDLMIIAPDLSSRAAGIYPTGNEFMAVRVFSGYVYLAVRVIKTSPRDTTTTIWRHSIGASGNLGDKELVLDMKATGRFASRTIRALTFSADGTMYIATDSPDPILIFDPKTSSLDLFYKGILPSYCKQFYWGTGNYLYMIRGDTALQQEWTVYRIDMGTTGAPYYGR